MRTGLQISCLAPGPQPLNGGRSFKRASGPTASKQSCDPLFISAKSKPVGCRLAVQRAGFTLLEVLLALALVGLVLVAMNSFIFSMSELWGRNNDVRAFDQHVRNVTRFMEAELRGAALPPNASTKEAAIAPKEVRTRSGGTEPLITFELPSGSRLISWPERPLPDVVCSLMVREREGLLLLWHSRLEKRFEQDPPRETIITPLVTGMSYEYYDPDFKRWQTEQALRREGNGDYKVPQRLRLRFTYGALTRESMIALPAPSQGLPFL